MLFHLDSSIKIIERINSGKRIWKILKSQLTWKTMKRCLTEKYKYRLGLSATPVRYLDNERDMAEELFETRVDGISLVEAIKKKIIPTPTVVLQTWNWQIPVKKVLNLVLLFM